MMTCDSIPIIHAQGLQKSCRPVILSSPPGNDELNLLLWSFKQQQRKNNTESWLAEIPICHIGRSAFGAQRTPLRSLQADVSAQVTRDQPDLPGWTFVTLRIPGETLPRIAATRMWLHKGTARELTTGIPHENLSP